MKCRFSDDAVVELRALSHFYQSFAPTLRRHRGRDEIHWHVADHSLPPAAMNFKSCHGHHGLPQWLQFIFIPRVKRKSSHQHGNLIISSVGTHHLRIRRRQQSRKPRHASSANSTPFSKVECDAPKNKVDCFSTSSSHGRKFSRPAPHCQTTTTPCSSHGFPPTTPPAPPANTIFAISLNHDVPNAAVAFPSLSPSQSLISESGLLPSSYYAPMRASASLSR